MPPWERRRGVWLGTENKQVVSLWRQELWRGAAAARPALQEHLDGAAGKATTSITTSAETGETSGWGQDSPFAKCKCLDRQKKNHDSSMNKFPCSCCSWEVPDQ